MSERFAPPQGRRPALDWMTPDELAVDDSYQRSLETNASRQLIRRIAAAWRWDLCLPLIISRRPSGEHYVVDGQHRMAAARLRGDIHVLPCFVRDLPDAAAEASLFVTANRARKGMTVLDDFHAALAAGDEETVTLAAIVGTSGLTIARSIAKPQGAGELVNVAGLRSALRRYDPEVVEAALTLMSEAFPDEELVNAGALFGAMVLIFAHESELDRDRLFEACLSRDTAGWSEFASLTHVSSGQRRAQVLRDALLVSYRHQDRAKAA